MNIDFIFIPEDTEITVIEELKDTGYKSAINTNLELFISADVTTVEINDPLECLCIRITQQEFKKMIGVYNKVIERISNV